MSAREIADRRQRALESAFDIDLNDPRSDVEVGIEVATQVKLTPEIVEAAIRAGQGAHMDIEKALVAALAALGFEVIE